MMVIINLPVPEQKSMHGSQLITVSKGEVLARQKSHSLCPISSHLIGPYC